MDDSRITAPELALEKTSRMWADQAAPDVAGQLPVPASSPNKVASMLSKMPADTDHMAHLKRAPTTATVIQRDWRLEMRCRRCNHLIVAKPRELREMFPVSLHLSQVPERLRCKRCGRKNPRMWIWIMGWAR